MEFPTPLLCLLPPPADWKGPSEIFAELSGYPYYKKIEAAGAAYQIWLKKKLGEFVEEEVKAAGDDAAVSKEDEARFARHKKIHVHMDDPYELMGLDHLRWRATEDDIKSAFRKLVLLYHPDKMADKTDADDELFKKISKANDTLIDPKKRRALDSQDQFDDSIPSANIKGEFYATFGPVFHNFSRWSVTQPAPLLGDADTPYDQVQKFYDFWYSFKSWRDHSYMDEYNLDDAESREERRWMEKQNAGERKKLKKEEMSTIFKLTENAEKQDPRIKKRKEDLANEKQRVKDEKNAEKRKRQEEIARKAQEEKEAKEREEKLKAEEAEKARQIRLAEKSQHTAERLKLRAFSTNGDLTWNPLNEQLEILVARMSLIQITELNQAIERKDGSGETLWKQQYEEMKKLKPQEPITSPAPVKNKAWTDQEIALLAQALSKIPGGSTERWERIANFVGTRTVKECIAKSKEGKAVPTKPSQLYAADDAFERFNKQKKQTAVEVKAEASLRDDVAIKANADAVAAAKEAANANVTTATLEKAIEWTPDEQKSLEKALQTYGAALTDRWDKIAVAVGKSKKECILRYKYLVAQIKAKSGK